MPTPRPTLVSLGASGYVLLDTWDVQALNKARYEQEMVAGIGETPIQPSALVSLPQHGHNILINGGFEYHNYNSTWPVHSSGADHSVPVVEGWLVYNGDATWGTGHPSPQPSPHAVWVSRTGGDPVILRQFVMSAEQFRGRRVYAFARVNGAAASLQINDDSSTTAVVNFPASAAWVAGSCSLLVSPTATALAVSFVVTGSGPAYIDDVTLAAEPGGIAYRPRQPALEYFGTDQRYAIVRLHHAWVPRSGNEIRSFAVRYRHPYEQPITAANVLLPSAPASSSNVVLASSYITSADQDGFDVQLVGQTANVLAYVRDWPVLILPFYQ